MPHDQPSAPQLRAIDPDGEDITAWAENAALVFKEPGRATPQWLDARRESYRSQRLSAAYDGETLVGTFRSWDTALTVPGGSVTAEAVSSVTVRPTHRRRGVLSAMMRADLDRAAGEGTPVVGLIASEAPIYGRYGFAPATRSSTWTLTPGRARFRPEVTRRGTVEVMAAPNLRGHAESVYARSRQPGATDRAPWRWDLICGVTTPPGEPTPQRVGAVHRDDGGEVDGLLVYDVEGGWADRRSSTVVHVRDLECATSQAYVGLWGYLSELDLVAEVRAEERATDEPLPWLLTDHRAAVPHGPRDFLWTRVLDPAAALAARRYEVAGRIVLQVSDPDGYAAGRFELTADPAGPSACEPSTDPAQVWITVEALSQLWLGGPGAAAAVVAGQLREHTPGAAARLACLLRTQREPWTCTGF